MKIDELKDIIRDKNHLYVQRRNSGKFYPIEMLTFLNISNTLHKVEVLSNTHYKVLKKSNNKLFVEYKLNPTMEFKNKLQSL